MSLRNGLTARIALTLAFSTSLLLFVGSQFGAVGIASALAIGLVSTFWSYWSAADEFLARHGAEPCRRPATLAALRALAHRAGLPPPALYEIGTAFPNAITLGAGPSSANIVLTRGLIRLLSEDELNAVLAHEVAHIKNRDVLAATIAQAAFEALSIIGVLLSLVAAVLRRSGGFIILAAAIATFILALLNRLALSRATEYRADQDGAELCGDAGPLIAALRKLNNRPRVLTSEMTACQLCFMPPRTTAAWSVYLSPYPTIEQQIRRLERAVQDKMITRA